MRPFLASACLALAGACTSFGYLDENLPKYVGKPIDLIVQRIGYPHGEVNVMNRKSYVWNSRSQGTFVTPTTTTGYIDNRPVQLTTYTSETLQWACTLRIVVDADNIVRAWSYEGNNQACYRFSERLIVKGPLQVPASSVTPAPANGSPTTRAAGATGVQGRPTQGMTRADCLAQAQTPAAAARCPQ